MLCDQSRLSDARLSGSLSGIENNTAASIVHAAFLHGTSLRCFTASQCWLLEIRLRRLCGHEMDVLCKGLRTRITSFLYAATVARDRGTHRRSHARQGSVEGVPILRSVCRLFSMAGWLGSLEGGWEDAELHVLRSERAGVSSVACRSLNPTGTGRTETSFMIPELR